MAESNANIGVRIGGDVTPLQNSLKKAENSLANFTKQARGAAKDIAKIGAAGAVAAAGGFAALFKSVSDNTREIQKLASVANVSVETLQQMSHGANSISVPMDKLSDILKDTTEKMGEFAATGGGGMKDFFENIAPQVGLTEESFKRLSGAEGLQAYYNALEKANLSQQDMTFYLESVASDSTLLIPLLKNNGEGFKKMAAEADELNAVLSSLDIASIEIATKRIDAATTAVKGAAQSFAADLSPAVAAVARMFVDVAKSSSATVGEIESGSTKAESAIGFVMDAVDGVRRAFVVAGQFVATFALAVQRDMLRVAEFIASSPIDAVNALIDALNSLPGIDIEAVNQFEFVAEVQAAIDQAAYAVNEGKAAMHATLMEPLPSEMFKQYANDARAAAKEAAAAMSEARVEAMSRNGNATGEEKEDKGKKEKIEKDLETEAERQARIDEYMLNSIKSRYETAEELEIAHREEMAIIGEQFDASKFASEQQWMEVRAQALASHNDAMNNLRQQEKINAINIASSLANSVMSLAQGHSKKAFELSKKVAVASAVIDGYKAATSAWAAGMATGGPWAPAVAAAYTVASLAKTGAQISAIRSQSFSGGGGQQDAGGSSFPAPSASASGGGGGGGSGNAGSVAINLPAGAIIRGDALLDMIEEAVNNGKSVKFLRA